MSGAVVPYVTAYEGESVAPQRTVCPDVEAADGIRLTYADATAHDSMFGVLWHRHGSSRAGRPLWKLLNTAGARRIVECRNPIDLMAVLATQQAIIQRLAGPRP